jgi:hypothetical protein
MALAEILQRCILNGKRLPNPKTEARNPKEIRKPKSEVLNRIHAEENHRWTQMNTDSEG